MSTKTDELMRLAGKYAAEYTLDQSDRLSDVSAALSALRADVQEVVKDAERYRKWREVHVGEQNEEANKTMAVLSFAWEAAEVDAIIDAAMKPEAP